MPYLFQDSHFFVHEELKKWWATFMDSLYVESELVYGQARQLLGIKKIASKSNHW